MHTMADTVFNYIRVPLTSKLCRSVKKDGEGVVCIRVQRPIKESKAPYRYLVSFAFCSTLDNFEKNRGRSICSGRALANKYIEVVHNEKLSTRAVGEIAINMIKAMKKNNQKVGFNTPAWISLL